MACSSLMPRFGYLIEDGECTTMVRDVSLSGEILQTLHTISLIGDDLAHHPGYCGRGRSDCAGNRWIASSSPGQGCSWGAILIDDIFRAAENVADEAEVFLPEPKRYQLT